MKHPHALAALLAILATSAFATAPHGSAHDREAEACWAGLVQGQAHVFRRTMDGELRNEDVIVGVA